MSTPNNRRRDPGGFGAETMMLVIGIGGVIATMVVLNVAVRLGHQLDGTGAELPTDPFAFTLGQGGVIPGWVKGLEGMKIGGRRLLIIPPALAYGPEGAGHRLSGRTLVFVIDLLGVG